MCVYCPRIVRTIFLQDCVTCLSMIGFYSNGQAAVNLYVPLVSLYSVSAGAYIIHEPAGLDTRQLVAVLTVE